MPRQYQSFKEQLHREYYVRTPSCNENKLTKHRFTIVKDVNENLSIDWGEEKNKLRTSIERTQKGTPPGPTKYISRNLCYTRHKVNDFSLVFFGGDIFLFNFFWFRVRSFGEEGGGANIYIYVYIFFPPRL